MDLDNTVVTVAIDQRIALKAIGAHYGSFATLNRPVADIARDYLGKIIQLPIQIGNPDPLHIKDYVQEELFKGREIEGAVKTANIPKAHPPESDSPGSEVPKENEEQSNSELSTQDISEQKEEQSQKTDVTILDSQVEPTVDDDDKDMEETDDEIRYFIQYTNLFRFTNPRLMRRLRNSYRILKKIESGKEGIKLLFMLFLLEYLYSRSSKTGIKEKTIEFDENVFNDLQFNTKILDEINKMNIDNLIDLQVRTEQVVLPYTPDD
jgi:hypothetical protein